MIDYQYDCVPKDIGHRELTQEEKDIALDSLKRRKFKGHSALFGDVDFSKE